MTCSTPLAESGPRVMYFMYHHYQHCALSVYQNRPPITKSPPSFALFTHLPPEIRLNIWATVAAEPQTIELSCTPCSAQYPKGRWFSHNKPPLLFAICAESREIALKEYLLLKFSEGQIGVPWPTLYINFDRDTLWVCNDLAALWAKDLLEKNELLKEKLRYLTVGGELWRGLNQRVTTSRDGFEFTLPRIVLAPNDEAVVTESGIRVVEGQLVEVRRHLKALERVEFHS